MLDSADVHGTDIIDINLFNEQTKLVPGLNSGLIASNESNKSFEDDELIEGKLCCFKYTLPDYEKPYTCKSFFINMAEVIPYAG